MPRANRHYLPGQVWHITHRCHKKEFLLRFARDRRRWVVWLRLAKKRFGLSVLDYRVTSNHIHLLVAENGQPEAISKAMQLIAGRIGQEYNQWTESVAVGDDDFVEEVKNRLGAKVNGRSIIKDGDQCQLRERQWVYRA